MTAGFFCVRVDCVATRVACTGSVLDGPLSLRLHLRHHSREEALVSLGRVGRIVARERGCGHPIRLPPLIGGTLAGMSINTAQRRQTSAELTALRASLPVSDEALASRLGWTVPELNQNLDMDVDDPRDAWRLRDFLVAVAQDKGIAVPEFSTLKDERRADAVGWFGSWDVPETTNL